MLLDDPARLAVVEAELRRFAAELAALRRPPFDGVAPDGLPSEIVRAHLSDAESRCTAAANDVHIVLAVHCFEERRAGAAASVSGGAGRGGA